LEVEGKLENMVKQNLMVLSQLGAVVVIVMLVEERNLFHQEIKEAGEGIGDIKDKIQIKMKSYGALLMDRKQIHWVMMIVLKRMTTFMGSNHKEEKEHSDLETGVGAVGTGETGKGMKGRTR
jgi:hypothetical protein